MRIRLAGMKICEMMGMEVRGMQPGFLIDEADRLRFDRLLNVVMNEPAVVELKLAARNRAGTYRATMLMMPLRSDFGDINRVIGCTSRRGRPLRAAARLPHRRRRGHPDRAEPGRRAAAAGCPGFAEAQAALRPAPPPRAAEAPRDRGQPERAGQAARRPPPVPASSKRLSGVTCRTGK